MRGGKKDVNRKANPFIWTLAILFLLPKEPLMRTLTKLFRPGFSLQRFLFLWQTDPTGMLYALLFLFIIIALISSFIRMVNPNAGGGSTGTARRQPVQRGRQHAEQPEQAIGCAHRTGKEKYLDQLNSYLRSGLIDREEYKVMRQRYERLQIDDDYHG